MSLLSGVGRTRSERLANLLNAGRVTKDVQTELNKLATSKTRADELPKKGGWRGLVENVTSLPGIKQVLSGAGRALELAGRPGQGIEGMIEQKIKNVKSGAKGLAEGGSFWNQLGDVADVVTGVNPALFQPNELGGFGSGLVGRNKEGGTGILRELGVPMQGETEKGWTKGNIGRGLAAFAIDVATDPFTWIAPEKVAADTVETLSGKLAQTTASHTAQKAAIEGVEQVARKSKGGIKRLSTGELRSAVNRATEVAVDEQQKLLDAWMTGKSTVMPEIAKAKEVARAAATQNQIPAHMIPGIERTAVDAFLAEHRLNLTNELMDAAKGMTQNRLGLKAGLLGKKLPGTKAAFDLLSPEAGQQLWRPFGAAGERLGATETGTKLKEFFSPEHGMPGLAQEMRNTEQMTMGFEDMIPSQENVGNLLNHTSQSQLRDMAHNFEKGITTQGVDAAGRPLSEIQNDLVQFQKDTYQRLIDAGFTQEDAMKSMMPHLTLKSLKRSKAAQEFLRAREAEWMLSGGQLTSNTLERAKALGFRPEENIGHSLLRSRARANQLLINQRLRSKFLQTYGVIADEAAGLNKAGNIKWTKTSPRYLTNDFKNMLGNKSVYLPKELETFFKTYDDLLRASPDAVTNSILRTMDSANRGFKRMATVYRPGYHVRNAISDVFTAYLDGVRPRAYTQAADILQSVKRGVPKTVTFDNFLNKTASELWHDFRTQAGGSTFMHTEQPRSLAMSMREARGYGQRLTNVAQGFAEGREDYFRFSHWLDATKDEFGRLRAGRNLGVDETAKLWEEAKSAATRRVNKYHFDYNAITPFEQQWAKRAIPFYTYTKKATPLMLESLLLNPGRMNMLPRATQALQKMAGVEPNGIFANFLMPEYLQGGNAVMLGEGKEPTILNLSGLPTNLLTPQGWGAQGGTQGIIQGLLAKASPAIQFPIEMTTKRDLYTGRPIKGIPDWLLSTYNPLRDPLQLTRERDYNVQQILGLPIGNVPEKTQLSAIHQKEEPISHRLALENQRLEEMGYAIKTSRRKSGTVYRLVQLAEQEGKKDKTIKVFKTPAQAQRAANRLG